MHLADEQSIRHRRVAPTEHTRRRSSARSPFATDLPGPFQRLYSPAANVSANGKSNVGTIAKRRVHSARNATVVGMRGGWWRATWSIVRLTCVQEQPARAGRGVTGILSPAGIASTTASQYPMCQSVHISPMANTWTHSLRPPHQHFDEPAECFPVFVRVLVTRKSLPVYAELDLVHHLGRENVL
jgi:hypothetical protein